MKAVSSKFSPSFQPFICLSVFGCFADMKWNLFCVKLAITTYTYVHFFSKFSISSTLPFPLIVLFIFIIVICQNVYGIPFLSKSVKGVSNPIKNISLEKIKL